MPGKKTIKPGSTRRKNPSNLEKPQPVKKQAEKVSRVSERVITEKITKKPPIFPIKFELDVIRPRDLLVLHFSFRNLKRITDSETGKVTLVRGNPADDAYIVVTFPPQSIEEQALFEVAIPEPIPVESTDSDSGNPPETPTNATPKMRSKLSGPSRLVFKVPKDAKPIDFTIEGLLAALKEFPLEVATTAKPVQPDEKDEAISEMKIHPGIWEHLKSKWAIDKINVPTVSTKSNKVAVQFAKNRSAIAQAQARYHQEKVGLVAEMHQLHDWTISEKVSDILEVLLPKPYPPEDLETAIEAPFRLILSPNRHAAWVHAVKEVVSVRQQFYAVPTIQFQPQFAALSLKSDLFDHYTIGKFDPGEIHDSSAVAVTMQANKKQILKEIAKIDPKISDKVVFRVKETDWVELWHTRLASRNTDLSVTEDPTNPLKTVRAIWAKDAGFLRHYNSLEPEKLNNAPQPFPNDASDNPYRASLDSADRYNFVHLSANYRLKNQYTQKRYIPRAIPTRQMMLTSLGSWLNLRGAWNPTPSGLEVEEWRHISTLARDHYVRVVYRGFLFPFGHRASLVKITERKFHNKLVGNPAYLRQRMFIVVREPEKLYIPMDLADPNGNQYDLAFPFTRVRITTLVTPLLAPPEDSDIGGKSRQLFRPIEGSNTKEVRFHVIATDLDGREVEFSTPMNFVGKAINDFNFGTEAQKDTAFDLMKRTQWDFTGIQPEGIGGPHPNNAPAEPAELSGQQVCYAPSQIQGDTALNTENIWFGAQIPEWNNFTQLQQIYSPDNPRFYPRLEFASAKIPAIQHLARNEGVAKFKYPTDYLKNGFAAGNAGQVFAQLTGSTLGLDFSSQGQRSGGLLTPNMQINGLSRLHGPVGGALDDLGSMTSNTFDPEKFFAGKMPMLFGAIDLWRIINALGGPPEFVTQALSPLQSLSDKITTLYTQLETLGSSANQLKTAITNALTCITNLLVAPDPTSAPLWDALENSLEDVKAKIPPVVTALNQTDISASVRIPIETALTSLGTTLEDVGSLIDTLRTAMDLLTEQKVSLDWKTDLVSWPDESSDLGPIFDSQNGKAKLYLHAEIDAKSTNSGGPTFMMSCGLKDFNLNLIGNKTITKFIYLKFDKIEFVMGSSQKADVNVEFGGIEFVGVLSFVEALKFLIPLDGFSDPPGLEITEEGITASLSLGLPNLTFGVFSLTNMSLGAGFSVPFIGDPLSVWFSFCTRDNPFCLTVAMFGGGGFFSITLQPNGLKCLEASFEFGANLTLDVGVASGGIYAMAGIYFKMEKNASTGDLDATLTGYFRMGGFLSVLGIISISIELYLELTYESATGKCTGRATLTIEVEILFFSVSVEITAERQFAGSNGDPTFAELMVPYPDPFDGHEVDPWLVYCEAFA